MRKPAEDRCLGMIEIDSVPRGIQSTDALIKEASVDVLLARPITPARYLCVFEGEVEAVLRSLARARDVAGSRRLDELFLPAPHATLLAGLAGKRPARDIDALGVLETTRVASCLRALDGALKMDEVELVELRLAMGLGGHAFFALAGEISAVEVAMEQAQMLAGEAHRDLAIVPAPDAETIRLLLGSSSPFNDLP